MGHGMSAALITIFAKLLFSKYAPIYKNPASLISFINKEIKPLLYEGQYLTSCYVIVDKDKNKLIYCSAGHSEGIICKYKETEEKIRYLTPQNTPMGIKEDEIFDSSELDFEWGDKLFLYSDGITEAKNENEEEFGLERLAEIIKKAVQSIT